MSYQLSRANVMGFIRAHQLVTESAKGPIPSVVRYIVGKDYQGSWWGLPDSSSIYNLLQTIRRDSSLLTCTLARGKVTFVHADAIPALVVLSQHFPPGALDKVEEAHGADGRHETHRSPLVEWFDERIYPGAPQTDTGALQRLDKLVPGLADVVRRLYASGKGNYFGELAASTSAGSVRALRNSTRTRRSSAER